MSLSSELTTRQLVENLKQDLIRGFITWFAPLFESWENERERLAAEREKVRLQAYEEVWDEFSLTDVAGMRFDPPYLTPAMPDAETLRIVLGITDGDLATVNLDHPFVPDTATIICMARDMPYRPVIETENTDLVR